VNFLSEKIKSPSSLLDEEYVKNRYLFLAILLLTVLIPLLYYPTLKWLVQIWSTDEQYSHGFLVPLISLYLIWSVRDCLKQIPIKASLVWGGLLILASLLLLLLGRSGAFIHAEGISLFFFLPGAVLFLLGWEFLKVLGMAIFYLQFMIPWLDPFFEKVQPLFQFISAKIAISLLALKYPVFADNLNIHLPNISFFVARECSGINFLVTIVAIGLPLVYLTQKTWTRALAIMGIACLLSILSNGLRVAIAGVMGEEFGPEMLHGPAHIFEGWFVAWVGWIGLFVANWLFGKIPYKNGEPKHHLYERWKNNENTLQSTSENVRAFRFHLSALTFLLLCFATYLNFLAIPRAVALATPLQDFPVKIGDWQGVHSSWLGENKFFPKLDSELSRVYRDQSGKTVYLFIGYYQKQDNEKRLVSYLSKPLYNNAKIITISDSSMPFEAASASMLKNKSNYATLFWYQFPNKLKMADRLQVKLHVLQSGIFQRQNNGTIILLATPRGAGSDSDMKSLLTLQTFAAELAPAVENFLP
jgi:EpsI family protein